MASLAAYMELGGIATLPREQLDSFLFDHSVALTLTEGMDWGALLGTAPTGKTYSLLRLMKEKMLHPEAATADFEESRDHLSPPSGAPAAWSKCLPVTLSASYSAAWIASSAPTSPSANPRPKLKPRALSLPI